MQKKDDLRSSLCDDKKGELVKSALLNSKDAYGNTLLHHAARNEMIEMYDHLVLLGADSGIRNNDGHTPFMTTARFGVWKMFNHIWENHLTVTMWQFGNTCKKGTDYSEVDWKGAGTYFSMEEIESFMESLLDISLTDETYKERLQYVKKIYERYRDKNIMLHELNRKLLVFEDLKMAWLKKKEKERMAVCIRSHFGLNPERANRKGRPVKTKKEIQQNHGDSLEQDDGAGGAFSAIRVITLFKPKDWYQETKDKIESVILQKWAQGFYLIHIGQSVVPFGVIVLVFGMMWWTRQLNILEHNFWWAEPNAVTKLDKMDLNYSALSNPVKANISELLQSRRNEIFGTDPQVRGLLPQGNFLGPDSKCGWWSIANSPSGNLQAALVIYGVPCLLRLAYTQRRIRPTDLDENVDMKISFEELVNFIYFNLESVMHVIMSSLFITIGVARVAAGDGCDVYYVKTEKDTTAIAALFLFINCFIVCKPYEGIGVLCLTIYTFLVSDVFNFLVMYAMFFCAFLISLQTLHNANHVFLAWMDVTTVIARQITNLTNDLAYLENANVVSGVVLQDTAMAIDGCGQTKRTLQDTGFTLLEMSFGDGLADALQQARRTDYECAGFTPDFLIGYILVFWVFLTNVLILNMLVAMMNYTFDKQVKTVRAVWILDVSYRIMRYQHVFPELTARMQRPWRLLSIWQTKYWSSFASDFLLVLYCIPEVHMWGFWARSSLFLSKLWRELKNKKSIDLMNLERTIKDQLLKNKAVGDKLVAMMSTVQGARDVEEWLKVVAKDVHSCQDVVEFEGNEQVLVARILVSLVYHLSLIKANYKQSTMAVMIGETKPAQADKSKAKSA